MYSTCLFCNRDLGANEIIEHFPIGRRLAYDAAKGRLWVVCRKCERWNLTPLEERWEAIEECERLFAETRLRVSTDNIGLARLGEGLELVRIGSALRPEVAAWRYGDQFGRRRTKHIVLSGAAIAAVGGLVILGPVSGIIAGGGWGTWQAISSLHRAYQSRRVRATLRVPGEDTVLTIRKNELDHAAIVRVDDGWALRVTRREKPGRRPGRPEIGEELFQNKTIRPYLFTGRDALHAASKLLPAINEKGAKPAEVQSAVTIVGEVGAPEALFSRYAAAPPGRSRGRAIAGGHELQKLPKEVRLALEMASHEEQERRALEGELAILEAAWRDAEEVAGIADNMFLPDSATDLDALRKRV